MEFRIDYKNFRRIIQNLIWNFKNASTLSSVSVYQYIRLKFTAALFLLRRGSSRCPTRFWCRIHTTLFVAHQRQEKRRERTSRSGTEKERILDGLVEHRRAGAKEKAKRFSSGDRDPLKIEGKSRPSVRYGKSASKLAATVSASKIFKVCLRKY